MSAGDALNTGTSGTVRAGRSIYLDALRAFALVRVVIYHATSNDWVTILTAMPLMFFIAGSLYAGSLERRPARFVIRDRYRRILFPYWVYIAAMFVLWASLGVLSQLGVANWVGLVFPVLGPIGPGEGTLLEKTWIALWYLQFHLILSLVGPWLRRAQQRHARATWITIGVLFVLGLAAGSGIVVVLFYVGCWILGYHQHDGDLEPLAQRWWLPICAVTGPLGAAAFALFQFAGADTTGSPVVLRVGALGAGMLGVFWLTLALGLRPRIEPWLEGFRTRSVVNWFSQRSLTIYMWHMAAIYAALELALPGTDLWIGTLAWCALGSVLAVLAVGWVEDVSARRRPTLWPRLTRPART